jgi:hypothetical protein
MREFFAAIRQGRSEGEHDRVANVTEANER